MTQDNLERDPDFQQAGLYLAHLIGCALAGACACARPEGVSWQRVHALAARSSVEGISWLGARTCDDIPSDLRKRWEVEANQTMYRRLSFDMERERVLEAMETRGLSYLPLKGILVADYYPSPEMRSMADNDILYGFVEPDPTGGFRICGEDAAQREQAVCDAMDAMASIMADLGYEAANLEKGNHDSFHKEPLFNFEMHRRLVSPTSAHFAYYENPWKRAIQSAENPCAYSFSDEDEYIYLLVHAFKHFDNSGCGIRFVVDHYVFLQRKGAGLDWDYVRAELARLELSEFEAKVSKLAKAAFGAGADIRAAATADGVADIGAAAADVAGVCAGAAAGKAGAGAAAADMSTAVDTVDAGVADATAGAPESAGSLGGPMDEDDKQLLWYLLGCGTYGNVRVRVERKLERLREEGEGASLSSVKRRYVAERLFLDEDTMRDAFPVFYKHRALRPLLPVYRMCRGAVRNRATVLRELKILLRTKD